MDRVGVIALGQPIHYRVCERFVIALREGRLGAALGAGAMQEFVRGSHVAKTQLR
jgi:hypothetical protein